MREEPRLLEIIDLGLCDYRVTHQEQRRLVDQKKKEPETSDFLLFVEHPDVYTSGRKGESISPTGLQAIAVERGGEVTFHNPGQLVAYPILSLEADERDLHRYLRDLEQVLIDLLEKYGLPAEGRSGATGVWLKGQQKKIASIGVAASNWITYHGVALNVCNDLSGFFRIRPCGFAPQVMTSLQAELGSGCPLLEEVKARFVGLFSERFARPLC